MEYTPTPLIGSEIALQATGDKYTFTIPFKCTVVRIGLVVTSSNVSTVAPVVKWDKMPTAGSGTGRGDGDVGTVTLAAANMQGKMYYEDPTSTINLDEGDQVVVEVETGATLQVNAVPILIVHYKPEVAANNSAMVAG